VPHVPWRSAALAAAVPGLRLCRLCRPGRHVRGHVARRGAVVEAPEAAAPAKAESAGWAVHMLSTCYPHVINLCTTLYNLCFLAVYSWYGATCV
jgi:hypothetical protein